MDDLALVRWIEKFSGDPKQQLNCYVTHEERQGDVISGVSANPSYAFGNLILSFEPRGKISEASWFAQDTWLDCQILEIESIQDGVKKLRGIRPDWRGFPQKWHRRSELVSEGLGERKVKLYQFTTAAPLKRAGCWSLISPRHILLSTYGTHPVAGGQIEFQEPQISPPSKAYLKLWELFTVEDFAPSPSEHVLDLGACPGGWSWVLAQLGCHVTSVDKAELAPMMQNYPNLKFIKADAFKLKPDTLDRRVDWLFSDVICEPARLLSLVNEWRSGQHARNFVCTLKFKAETDMQTTRKFAELMQIDQAPVQNRKSGLIHLNCNRHELTYYSVVKNTKP